MYTLLYITKRDCSSCKKVK